MISDNSQESKLCSLLVSSSFIITLDFSGFIYTYPTQIKLNSSVSLEFPCSDSVNHCASAFAATSVQFTLTFPETNTIVQDVVSTFKIGKYDRLTCLQEGQVQYDTILKSFTITAIPGNCQLQYQQSLKATVSLFVYPDFYLSKQFDLAGISSLTQLFTQFTFNCDTDFTDTDQSVCNRIMEQFSTSLNNMINFTLSLPAAIPNALGVYSRASEFSVFTQISTVTSTFVRDFDCYMPFQEAVFFPSLIRLTFILNDSAVNCNKPVSEFIGNVDSVERILRVIDDEANVSVQFKFVSDMSFQKSTKFWLECINDEYGEQQCLQNIQKVFLMKNPRGILLRDFKLSGVTVKEIEVIMSARATHFVSHKSTLNMSHMCFDSTNFGEVNDYYQVQAFYMVGAPRFFTQNHNDLLMIRGQIHFPGDHQIRESGTYCLNYQLENKTLYEYIRLNQKDVTVLISFLNTQIAVTKNVVVNENVQIDYYLILCTVVIILSFVWLQCTLTYERRRGTI
ncbi:Conserved_hypothetical protein [Hexamita inflata]|uniref:Uncharacterized protein n=1 Tax=Hexamita inflata TaxID=28002 RepID=A0AA86UWD9_9EUKA|nr:Conserved hypothetical protein [Hexamita inflata]CAI9974545.1 Conserved hypothetical protein [Hexamita inflata]